MNYLVMETHESYAVLLSEDGQFVIAANLNYEVGETISDPVIMKEKSDEVVEPPKVKRFTPKKIVKATTVIAAAALLLLFFIGLGNRYLQENRIDSSIYLAINPEIQMDLNEEGHIIELEGLNPDGEQLIDNYELTNHNRLVVTRDLIDLAIEMDYLTDGDHLSFRIDADAEQFQTYGNEIQAELTQHLEDRVAVTMEISSIRDGEVIEQEEEPEPASEPEPETEPESEEDEEEETGMLTLDEAKEIAVAYAGLSLSDVYFDDVEFDTDDGVPFYELEFETEAYEYEIEVHAITGAILDYEVDDN